VRRDHGGLSGLVLAGRLRAGLTQEELAERATVSVRTVRNVEGGQVRPRLPTVRLLAQAMRAGDDETERMIATVRRERGADPVPPDPARPVPAQLPMDVPGFTGRDAELRALDGALDATGTGTTGTGTTGTGTTGTGTTGTGTTAVIISAVSGTAGVGKTALAVHWAHRVRERFPDGQLYVNLRGYDPRRPVPSAQALAGFLTALGVGSHEVPLDAAARAAMYRTELAGRRVLVVLDNASSVEQVRPLLPGSPSCVVVVTSRDRLSGLVALHGARRLDLDLLSMSEAVALLGRLIGDRVERQRWAAATLATECARLPLALRIAAELAVSRPAASLADLAADLADGNRRLELLGTGDDPRAAVSVVFSWSLRRLPPAAARTFTALGLHPGPDIDDHAAAALTGTPLPQVRQALATLARAHLIEAGAPGRYGMHDLLRAYAAGQARSRWPATDRSAAQERLLDYYLAAAAEAADLLHPADTPHRPDPGDPTAARTWLDAELPALAAAVAHAATQGWPAHAVGLSAALFRYLDAGHHLDALSIHGYAQRAAHRTGDRRGEACAMCGRGHALYRLGSYRPAAGYFHRALAVFREIGDLDGEARALNDLGFLEERQGDYRSAARRHEEALALFHRLGDRAGEANAVNLLGIIEERRGRYAAAAGRHEHALTLARRAGDRLGQAHALNGLGAVRDRLGRDAAGHFHEALSLFRRLGNRTGEAWTLNNIGVMHTRQGRPGPAVEHHDAALSIAREAGDRAGEAWAHNGLGEAAQAMKRYAAALAHHGAALAADSVAQDQRARAHAGLGNAYHALGDRDRACGHYTTALTIYTSLGMPAAEDIRAAVRF
jgi:tetratricopeptide (TPR) repeat protein/DNA-binding XRE family transcriptional regulator